MEPATLGGVPGAANVRWRRRSAAVREYRGTFVSAQEHKDVIARFLEARERVEFDGVVDGERKKLNVTLTDVSPETGIAHFEGAGEG